MSETDLKPPVPPTPKAAAKHGKNFLKGRPTWQYIAGITVLIGVAYMVWKRQQGTPVDDATLEQDPGYDTGETGYQTDGPAAAGSLGGGYVYAPPTQGAYGGFSDPMYNDGSPDSGQTPAPQVVYNISAPTLQQAPDSAVPTLSSNPTGGGPPTRPAGAHLAAPAPAKVAVGALVHVPDNKAPGYKGTAKAGANTGRRYKVVYRDHGTGKNKRKWIYHDYESSPNKADYGRRAEDRVAMGPA